MRRRDYLKASLYAGTVLGTGGAIGWAAANDVLDGEEERDCLEEGNESFYDGEYDNIDKGLENYENDSGPAGGMSEQICERSEEEYNGTVQDS